MNPENNRASRALERFVRWIQRGRLAVILLALLAGAGLLRYTQNNLSIDTNNQNMLSAELDWRKAEAEMDRLFPDTGGGLVVVLEGEAPESVAQAQATLVAGLRAQPELFRQVSALETEGYFRRNGLLFLSTGELQVLADGLIQAQPFLGTLAQDTSLSALFGLLRNAVTSPAAADFDMSAALTAITRAISTVVQGEPRPLSWQELMGGAGPGDQRRRFVQVAVVPDYSQLLPADKPIRALREIARELQIETLHGVRLRLTGTTALEHEELQTAFTGMGIVMAIAMVMVMVLLYLALRSVKLVIATVVTLVYGLLATAAFAAATVGHLNLISVAFSMLYVGLGLDYALYLCMQYRELRAQGMSREDALPRSAGDVGGFMGVCAATTALGFFAFVPTSFTGIAELGLISGAGMFISLALSLTLLPALISLMPPDSMPVPMKHASAGWMDRLLSWPYVYARQIWVVATALACAALLLASQARFDYDPINLRDPASESVSTFRDLLKDPSIPTLTLSIAARDAEAARQLSFEIGQLPLVARAMSLRDFVPQDQAEKLTIIDDLRFSLGPLLASGSAASAVIARDADMARLHELLMALDGLTAQPRQALPSELEGLKQALRQFDADWRQSDEVARERLMQHLRESLLGAIPLQLESLRQALRAEPVDETDLPGTLIKNWRSEDGHYRVQIWPRERLDNPEAIERFVSQVRTAHPSAVGGPVGVLEAGHAVVLAFKQAFLYSFVAITLLLLVLLRSIKDTLLVLVPLTLAGLLTVAGAVLAGIPFNFANVIALPLILGVGVDYGVYLVQRGRFSVNSGVNILQTSTARAVLFGALITTASFGNLALARHPGMVSMGLLLTLGLGMTLLCALVLLPGLLVRVYGTPEEKVTQRLP